MNKSLPLPQEADRTTTEDIIREWRRAREVRLAEQKIVDQLEKEEKVYKAWLIEVFQSQKYEGMVVDGRITGVADPKEIPVAEDRQAFQAYILETGQLDLLEFRISKSAVEERKNQGVEIPGLGFIETYNLYDRKA